MSRWTKDHETPHAPIEPARRTREVAIGVVALEDLLARAKELSRALGRMPEDESSESDRAALRRELDGVQSKIRAMGALHISRARDMNDPDSTPGPNPLQRSIERSSDELDAQIRVRSLNSPLRGRPEATRLKEASIAAAMSAVAVCQIGQSKAAGRVEHSRRKTALQDLKDHWSRAIKAKTSADALAELAHASLAAREAHGSDEYERRAIEIVEGPKPQRQDSRISIDADRTRATAETSRHARDLLDKISPIDWTSVESGDRVRILPARGGNDGFDGSDGTVSHFDSVNGVREEVAVEIGDQVVWFPLRRVVLL